MTILVTGAGGFLGRRIVQALLLEGHLDVRMHFRRLIDAPAVAALSRQFPDARIEPVAADLLHRGALPALVQGVDTIIHAAAAKRGAAADMYLNTVVGTRNLLDAAAAAKCPRIVLVSSFATIRTAELAGGALLDEKCEQESTGVEKGAYGFVKLQQELLLKEYRDRHGFELVVLRPGVIYGPGDSGISPRVGLQIGPLFFALGGGCRLPLTYVDNCADAIVRAALHAPPGTSYSVVDDDLPTCRQFLKMYRREVVNLRVVPVPHWALALGARALRAYSRRSSGQLPAVFTPYIVRSMYRPLRYSNEAIKQIGWRQRVATGEGLERAMRSMSEARG